MQRILFQGRSPLRRTWALCAVGLLLPFGLSACSELPGSYPARLAEHLRETGAQMYGAYWCPHCAAQKDYFGSAASQLPYIECDPQGLETQAERCADMGIEAYPTWIIGGEYYQGALPLGKLAALSGFETPAEAPTSP